MRRRFAVAAIAGIALLAGATAVVGQHRAYPGYECARSAQDVTGLTDRQILHLCSGATTAGPVSCYETAQDELVIGQNEAIDLCRCAVDALPVDCYAEADEETTFDGPELLAMCNARTLLRLTPLCLPQLGWSTIE